MDQLPRGNDGFSNNNLFGDSHQYNNAYDNLFQSGTDQNPYDASWGVNASNYPAPSQQSLAPSWPQSANHLSTTSAGINGQPSPYGRSLSHSPVPYGQNAFNNFNPQQNFAYPQPQYDPALVPPQAFNQGFNNFSGATFPSSNAGTIAPHALQQDPRQSILARSPYETPNYLVNNPQPRNKSLAESAIVDQHALVSSIPEGRNAGYFSVINFDELSRATGTERMGSYTNIGPEPQHWDVNRAALPAYTPRRSRNDLRKTAGNDQKLLKKLGKKIVKHERSAMIAPRTTALASAASASHEKIKYEGDSSSEESSSDDDDDSSYTSDEATEMPPLPPKRPTSPKAAIEYDTIKALWRSKRRRPDADSIRKGIVDFWEIAKTIRDRWKADGEAVKEAQEKKRVNEIPLLKSRVQDQREMMESAFKAALKHGHRDIVELYVSPPSLLLSCHRYHACCGVVLGIVVNTNMRSMLLGTLINVHWWSSCLSKGRDVMSSRR